MPVKARGKKIVEVATGKVVGHSKTAAMAKKAATARNLAHARKRGYDVPPPKPRGKKRSRR